jgi:alkylation response protein AidB-like acyl-CoA dehydrogenase
LVGLVRDEETAPRLPRLRRSDYSLSELQHDVRDSAANFFERECPISVVRDADPLAFDEALWRKVRDLGFLTMSVPEPLGDGAGLVDLALVAEERGRRLAPVPLVEHATVLRLLAALGADEHFARYRDGSSIATFAPAPQRSGVTGLVPFAPVASAAVGLVDGALLLSILDGILAPVRTLGGVALGRVDLAGATSTVLAEGATAVASFGRALREWQLLTAASLVGLAAGALDLTVAYAKERVAFGVPIGTFQALSHPLADVRTAIEGARRLVWRAAWFLDHEPESAAVEVALAYLHATETANRAASVGIHTQGGFGFTLESDLHLFFRRAKSWPLVAGDPQAELLTIADLAFGPVATP